MTAPLRHFALNATDVDAARRFYGAVFGWGFQPWGPPGFFHIDTGDGAGGDGSGPAIIGALQRRRELLPGVPMRGLEGTFAVADVAAVVDAARVAGGRLLNGPTTIAGVGELAWLADPDGNAIGAMRFDPTAD